MVYGGMQQPGMQMNMNQQRAPMQMSMGQPGSSYTMAGPTGASG